VKDEPAAEANGTAEAAAEGSEKKKKKKVGMRAMLVAFCLCGALWLTQHPAGCLVWMSKACMHAL